jgi:hypothetical protein
MYKIFRGFAPDPQEQRRDRWKGRGREGRRGREVRGEEKRREGNEAKQGKETAILCPRKKK